MTLAAEVIAKLAEPLDAKRIRTRQGGGGKSLSYIEGHDAIRTANEIFGVGNWGYEVVNITPLGAEKFQSANGGDGARCAYLATVRVEVNGVPFSDVGFGDSTDYSGSQLAIHENAAKEAVTDGLKRCLKNLGDQFGLCLYDKAYVPSAPGTGASQASAGSLGGAADRAAVTAPPTQESPAVPTSDGWTWPFGKHKGKSLAETDDGYLTWFLENSDKEDIKERVREFRNGFADFQGSDSDIPFDRTIDGLGG